MEVNDSKDPKKLCKGCFKQVFLNNVSFNICLTSFCSPFASLFFSFLDITISFVSFFF